MGELPKQDVGRGMVGIFWLVNRRLIVDQSLLSNAEPYGECLVHARSHIDYWGKLRANGTVPADSEYDEFPRGRTIYNAKEKQFYLLADKCIRRARSVVNRIIMSMELPGDTVIMGDLHYRCRSCLRGKNPLDSDS